MNAIAELKLSFLSLTQFMIELLSFIQFIIGICDIMKQKFIFFCCCFFVSVLNHTMMPRRIIEKNVCNKKGDQVCQFCSFLCSRKTFICIHYVQFYIKVIPGTTIDLLTSNKLNSCKNIGKLSIKIYIRYTIGLPDLKATNCSRHIMDRW